MKKSVADDNRKKNLAKAALLIITLLNLVLFIAYLVVGLTVFGGSTCDTQEALFAQGRGQVKTYSGRVVHNFQTKEMLVYDASRSKYVLRGSFARRVDFDDYQTMSVSRLDDSTMVNGWTNDYVYAFRAKSRAANLEFSMRLRNASKLANNAITCDSYEWRVTNTADDFADQEFEDCFDLDDGTYWYGQTESKDQQYWPINKMTWPGYKAYLSGFIDDWGSILERYWLSTSGVALIVDRSVPLFVAKNETSLCFLASSRWPYDERKRRIVFKYDLCRIDKETSTNDYMNQLQLYVMNNYFALPTDIPDLRMIQSPIWSTWANFKALINESVILKYASDIKNKGYSNSQLEIDDKWSTNYGDFEFDKTKFPDISAFISLLNTMGYRTTLWIHPFTNLDSANLSPLLYGGRAVRSRDSLLAGLTSWWQGLAAMIVDTTNPNATDWFVEQLEGIRAQAGIDSFKFDAGEINWLPRNFELVNATITPDQYCSAFARMAARFGKMIEVRVGCGTQDLPVFVRMLDKDSNWGYDNGLKSVLTTSLTMSILGYPFILPDMIGGNAYIWDAENIDFNGVAYPDYELYLRWAQMTAFLPSMQFSIPPWHYDEEADEPAPVNVNDICKRYVDLHESLVAPLIEKYGRIATQTGEPIIRPIWWIDNSDVTSQQISDEFLVGAEILVAPVTDKNVTVRDIYLPKGKWRDGEIGDEFEGPTWLRNYTAPIQRIPYFIAF